ncbi:MAG: hypothetical protein DRI86_06590 [Bacteroidetes bacterium]|nr:MAG: hypothetical protein DRI86_06590 [Bacteroidota bacterium]
MIKLFILFFTFSLLYLDLFSQDTLVNYQLRKIDGERPKIGLVLSGGGAKGMAHVGVLKVLDSLGIKPDYITGTSMGSIVGGLYSIGYSTDMLEEMVRSTDWNKYLSNDSEYRGINMIEKESYKNYFEFPINNWLPGLPQGAIKGQELELLFNELTVSVAKDTVFDEFPIPFRAIAVDILTGEPYTFKSGNLALAMRSSMSIPSIMDPVEYKGMLLVDGGLVNNFPVQECIDMGADIIIGVYTGAELMPENKLNSMVSILKQSSFIASIKNARESKKLVDIYIEPYLSDRNAAVFDDGVANCERGYEAGVEAIVELQELMSYLSQYNIPKDTVYVLSDSVFISTSNIKYKDDNDKLEKVVRKNYKQINNEFVTPTDIVDNIHFLYGTRLFKKLTYDYSHTSDSVVDLRYNVEANKDKDLLLSINYKTESKAGLNIGFRYRNLLIPGARFQVKLRISENPGARVDLFSYLGSSIKHGFDISYYYKTSKIPLYSEKILEAEYSSHFHRLSSGYHFFASNRSEFYTGIGHERVYYTKIIDVSELSFDKITNLSSYIDVNFARNTLDKKYFSTKGSSFKFDNRIFLVNTFKYDLPQDYIDNNPNSPTSETDDMGISLKIAIDFQNYMPINNKLVSINEINAVVGIGYIFSTWVGGVNPEEEYQIPFWGVQENYTMVANVLVYSYGMRYNFINNFYLTGKLNGGFIAEDVSYLFSNDDDTEGKYSSIYNIDNYMLGGGLKLSYNSFIGPVSIAVTKGSQSSAFWWHFLLGYSF